MSTPSLSKLFKMTAPSTSTGLRTSIQSHTGRLGSNKWPSFQRNLAFKKTYIKKLNGSNHQKETMVITAFTLLTNGFFLFSLDTEWILSIVRMLLNHPLTKLDFFSVHEHDSKNINHLQLFNLEIKMIHFVVCCQLL